MRIKEEHKDELRDLYVAKRDANEVWNEACSAIAEKYGVKPARLKKRIRMEVEGKLEAFIEETQAVLDLG